MQELECDVLIVGGGLAGAWAALRAAELAQKVILVEKGRTGRAGQSAFSGANILCPLSGDDLDAWQKEITVRGQFMSDQDWVQTILAEMEARTGDMERMGVEFEKDGHGNLVRSVGLAHQVTRLSTVNSLQMMACFRKNLEARGVSLLDRFMVTRLLTSDGCHPTKGRVTGVVGFHTRSGEPAVISARATIVTTGGAGHFDLAGDGICQSFLAGAELTGMEFARCFDKMAFGKKWIEVHLNSFQRYGMVLRNRNGERFMESYEPRLKERSPRQTLGLSILSEHLKGNGPTYMDLTHLTADDMQKLSDLPATTRNIQLLERDGVGLKHGKPEINITSGFIRFLGGGVRHNLCCESTVPGLYVAGEAGGYPGHGTYSVGGMNLAECCVEGYRAGEYAARFAREVDAQPNKSQINRFIREIPCPLKEKAGMPPDDLWYGLQEYISPAAVSVFRTARSIDGILARIKELRRQPVRAGDIHELARAHKTRNYLLAAQLVFTASREREECRGCNIRADFPYRDDANWLTRIVLNRDRRAIRSRRQAIPIYRYPVRPEKYERVPFPFPVLQAFRPAATG